MTHLHRIIGTLAATLVELAMAGAFGAAPTVVLDIPTPVATRMSPCPVHAGIDIASSSTGDSSSWDQCRIMWQLEADGSALADWPSKYRYVTDPRPGLNSKQIDLAGQTDTGNYNRPRGFNFGWVLTAGTWRVKCTVTNPEGLTTATTSSDITIAADTRTEYTVQASGGDYTTLAAALSARAATSNVKITVEDGHTENITAALTTVTGDNFVIQQAGTGTKPVLTYSDATDTGAPSLVLMDGESFVVEGIVFTDSTGNVSGGTFSPTAYNASEAGAFAFCEVTGDTTNLLYHGFRATGDTSGVVVLGCSSEVTKGYSWVASSGLTTFKNICIVGCTFGYSTDESIIRTVGAPDHFNAIWCDLDNTGTGTAGKSCLRFNLGSYLHGYGNNMNDDNWTGSASPGQTEGVDNIRTEANFSSNSLPYVTYFVDSLTLCNNIATLRFEFGTDTSGEQVSNCHIVHNTYLLLDGDANVFAYGGRNEDAYHSANRVAANLFAHEDPADMTMFFLIVGDSVATWANNTFPATQTNLFGFVRTYNNGLINENIADLDAFNAKAFATGNTERDATLDASYRDSNPTTVSTEAGVYDDYYGDPRGTTSYVGAVGAPLLQTIIPGLYIDQQ